MCKPDGGEGFNLMFWGELVLVNGSIFLLFFPPVFILFIYLFFSLLYRVNFWGVVRNFIFESKKFKSKNSLSLSFSLCLSHLKSCSIETTTSPPISQNEPLSIATASRGLYFILPAARALLFQRNRYWTVTEEQFACSCGSLAPQACQKGHFLPDWDLHLQTIP